MPAETDLIDAGSNLDDRARVILDDHAGDALAALRTVIADAEFLFDQLETALMLISPGLVRGWKPKFQREDGPRSR
ncbi:hypothetical protein [Rhizobium sp. P44RR-XXIV]|uniref:hypothetical protein n=1 Tax=Rhizobium sp. P44RR-XXIV TaxID=1921145 RepID=UPI00098756B8|nr:hypothetical protein [Rhizobium sp. P44RR-XXIV]TIX89282.1 hypothetical protein BSK43_022055 [Rhizobium sp. P44RR-XXIV]